MRLAVLGSGSAGNAVVVESEGRALLVDAGFPRRRIESTLEELGTCASSLDALLVTHEHHDHVRGAASLARRHRLPVYATAGTLEATSLDKVVETKTIRSGEPFEVRGRNGAPGFRVEPFRLPHDAREPVGFVIEDGRGRRLGVVTDLGCRSQLAWGRLRDLDGLVLETNHDLQMLRMGPYPWHLKQRVAGRHGHLSNREAADGLAELVGDRLQWVVLFHLSRTNNLPEIAADAIGERLDREGSRASLALTSQDAPTPWLEVAVGKGGQLALAL